MKNYFTIQNEKAEKFEIELEDLHWMIADQFIGIRERDFMTDFIFEDLTDGMIAKIENIKNNI